MESLLPAPRSGSAALRIPYLRIFQHVYVPGGFTTLQGVQRFHYQTFRSTMTIEGITSLDLEERASCLQAWLFFGLISEFFDRNVVADAQFVQRNTADSSLVVNVAPSFMHSLFIEWATQLSNIPRQTRDARVRETMQVIDFAGEQCERFDDTRYKSWDLDQRPELYALAAVLLSIKLLISYLRTSIELYFQAESNSTAQNWLGELLGQLNSAARRKEILANVGKIVGGDDHTKMLLPLPPGGKESLTFLLLLNRFRANHWCPIRARQLCRVHNYSIVNYLSRVQRTDPDWVSHQRCENAVVCEAYNLTEEMQRVYTPKHATRGCTCQHFEIKKDVLVRAIEQGAIPILSMDPQVPTLDIRLHRQNGVTPYIAISHVWSDGLGNPHANSLPLCQLRRIASMLTIMKEKKKRITSRAELWYSGQTLNKRRAASRRVFFWMDTLCIPVKPARPPNEGGTPIKEIKRRAIRHITPIFQGADQILVLDAELEEMQLRSSEDDEKMLMTPEEISRDEEELTARVLGCKWLQRAWTLEEGALARDCQFKVFRDGTMSLGELVPPGLISREAKKLGKKWAEISKKGQKKEKKKRKRGNGNEMLMSSINASTAEETLVHFDTSLKLLLAGPLNESRKQAARPGKGSKELKLFMKSRSAQFVDAWNNLLERSATKQDDPVLIFANILDFNSASIAKIDLVVDRLPILIKSCEELPLSLLFNTKKIVRRMTNPKDSWIPSRIEGDRLVHGAIMKKWKAKFSGQVGLEFDTTQCPADSLLILFTDRQVPFDDLQFRIELQNGHASGPYVVEIFSLSTASNISTFHIQSSKAFYEAGKGTCLIIDKSTGTESVNGYTGRGARFSIFDGPPGVLGDKTFLRYDSPIRIWSYDQWHFNHHSSALPTRIASLSPPQENRKIILEYDSPSWVHPRRQRDLLPSPSLQPATLRGLVTGICGIIAGTAVLQIYAPSCDSSSSDSSSTTDTPFGTCLGLRLGPQLAVIFIIGPLLFWSWKWYRGRVYKKWLRTFDDKWDSL